ncbi:hypothetical protein M409DRAFT_71288 [Zasmidium cellare ATCC 36951]|uniref:Uncharacterized protein n=1 Tax=Zasmidium cellare ATCC 36951 TaxID=1080233 RepID=A0A6A6BW62_ZASCE|nr:uncharacterized protein M409DRAFT_71288 [Zasmidium cellare ATCC 36951]KAF2159041.1 hypothetical protein M409DRAFT_71288 [Zasmidium cellare ATCC 36951]
MALPSSPPPLPDLNDELPSSPPLPTSSALPALPNRKRPLDYDNNNLSSDPLFSEDPSEAEDQTEYEQPKRKRMVKGPWWTLGRRSSQQSIPHTKDNFRNADSGVFLGSDESIDSLLNNARDLNVADRIPTSSSAVPHPSLPQGERIAQQTIGDCVESGHDAVDLSALGLEHMSSETLKPLHQLIRQSHGTLTEPPSEDEFVALTPSIKLFLARNQLRSLPAELFRLENVTVLSLRSNDLTELPYAIARLRNLKELNIAGNNIRLLPWELMRFLDGGGESRRIIVRPNPLLEPTTIEGPSPLSGLTVQTNNEDLSRWGDTREYYEGLRRSYQEHGPLSIRAELELRLKLGRLLRIQYLQEASRAGREVELGAEELIFLASSAIRWNSVDGTPLHRARPDRDPFQATLDPLSDAPEPATCSFAPSLFELASRSAQKEFNLQELPSDIPAVVRVALDAAARGVEMGNQTCSTCGRAYIKARAEWVEYWHNGSPSQTELKQENILPFLRRVCSWRCATPTPIGEFRC